jgi:hypothetical protein
MADLVTRFHRAMHGIAARSHSMVRSRVPTNAPMKLTGDHVDMVRSLLLRLGPDCT